MPTPRSLGSLIILLALVGLTPLSPVGLSSVRNAQAVSTKVSLIGYYNIGWNGSSQPSGPNPLISLTQGDTLVITTSSGDGFPHHFFVDVDGDGMSPNCSVDKCASVLSPPTTTSSTDTLTGFAQGTYFYYCEYHPAMKGTFRVLGAPDFTLTPNPQTLTINQGTSKTSTITISSLSGFSGTVTFSSPSAPTGIAATLTSSMVTVSPSSAGTTTLNVTVGTSTTPGSYTVSVTGSGGGKSHTANVAVTVVGPDFTISLDKQSLNIVIGATGNATVTLTSQNGFSGTVNLAATISPIGPSVSITPTAVSLTPGGSGTSRLTITTSSGPNPGGYYSSIGPGSYYSSINPGSYMVNVTATASPSLSHLASISVTVTSPSVPAPPIPVYVLLIAVGVIAVAIIVTALVVLRRRRGK